MKHTLAPRNRVRLWALWTAISMACGSPEPPPPAEAPKASPPGTGAGAEPATASPTPAITDFGVAECDTYVKKYMECVEGKVSGEARDALLATFEANRTKWRAMSTMREAAVALGIACKAAAIKAKEELSVEYGCEFQ